ncbi:MAG: ABC transporter substrate-binding protein [Mesorhizobium sp.]|nr:ABC transporter substrate-binding protein [Mesorhizobium sp.]
MLLAILFLLLLPANHSRAELGHEFFNAVQARIVSIRRLPGGQRSEACAKFVHQAFDTVEIASGAAALNWVSMGPGLRTELASSIAARLAKECVGVVTRMDPAKASVARIRETPNGIKMTVVFAEAEGKQGFIVWSIRPGGAFAWTAVDLSVDGRGLLAALKSDFDSALIATGGNLERAIGHFSRMIFK